MSAPETIPTPEAVTGAHSDSVRRLVRLLSFHTEWTCDEYTLKHISGMSLWQCNGLFFLYVREPESIEFTFLEKLQLWWHVKRCMRATNRKGTNRLERLGRLLDEA